MLRMKRVEGEFWVRRVLWMKVSSVLGVFGADIVGG